MSSQETSMAPENNGTPFRVLDPTATQSIATDGMAERPESLAGMRVGLLRNDKLNSEPEFLSDFSNEVDVALLANGD
jgi:hypothetical protein